MLGDRGLRLASRRGQKILVISQGTVFLTKTS